MTINDEMKIRELYKSKTDDELRSEFERISADPFGTFDFNNNDSLRILLCSTNLLKSINIDNCIFLETLKCDYNNQNDS